MRLLMLVRRNLTTAPDPDAAYLEGYRKGRADEAAAHDLPAPMVEAEPVGDGWPDAARWTSAAA